VASAYWQGATGGLAGAIVLMNTGSTSCSMSGRPGVQVVDATGAILPITEIPGRALCELRYAAQPCSPGSSLELQPGGKAMSSLLWGNWCREELPQPPLDLVITLPTDQANSLDTVVQDAAGNPVGDTARCNEPQEPSEIAVGPFESSNGP
jgi:hypothetical protein